LSSVRTVRGVPRCAIAVLLPAFGPLGVTVLEALLFHSTLKTISFGFPLASIVALFMATYLAVVLGIRSLDVRSFRYLSLCAPISVVCVLALADGRITPIESLSLVGSYGVFVLLNWWLESACGPCRPAADQDCLRRAPGALTPLVLGIAVAAAGSGLLVHGAVGGPASVIGRQSLLGMEAIAALLIFVSVALRRQASDLAIASVAGFLSFSSAVTLGVFGMTAHDPSLDPVVHVVAAMAIFVIPAILLPVAMNQPEQFTADDHRRHSESHMDNIFAWRNLKRDLSNYQLLSNRDVDGNLVTGMNSGTHWLSVMLANAIARQHGLALPKFFSFDAAGHPVGTPRALMRRPGIPAIALYHNQPAAPLAWPIVRRFVFLPKQVVLVRDIRDVLISAYVKWLQGREIPFSEFVRGDPGSRHGYLCDVWWYVSFLNRWGDMKRCAPEDTLIVRYEDLVEDTAYWLRRVGEHFGLGLCADAINAALALREKDAAQVWLDPKTKRVIQDPKAKSAIQFSDDDMRALRRILERHLRYDFGYDYGLQGAPLIRLQGPGDLESCRGTCAHDHTPTC